jgi:NadR type nicotinamide-nucleotide adenylyltransferase
MTVKKIALLGAESTGKSGLCEALALHYGGAWVPEFARDYLEKLEVPYTLEDILFCAEMQVREEDRIAREAKQFLFCDTELINFKVWSSDIFQTVPQWIEEKIQERRYDFYLLTANDTPFIPDAVRTNPHRREFLFDWYQRELEHYGFEYAIVSGQGKTRLLNAIAALEKKFSALQKRT